MCFPVSGASSDLESAVEKFTAIEYQVPTNELVIILHATEQRPERGELTSGNQLA
jgi:hypothetical protein